MQIADLVHSYREMGHLVADLDPLGHNMSHHPLLEQICSQAVFFAHGVVEAVGPFADVRDAYLARV